MQISLSSAQAQAWSGTVLALGITEGDPQGWIPAMEERFSISLSEWLEQRKFSGRCGESTSLQLLNPHCTCLVLLGMGPLDSVDINGFRQAAAAAKRRGACRHRHGVGTARHTHAARVLPHRCHHRG